jgi:HAD superfamily hydrolase (TIGR01509 family)
VTAEATVGGRGTPDALLWDFDGVLADTEHAHHEAWNATLKPYGIQFTWEEYLKQCVGVADPIVARRLNLPDGARAVEEKQRRLREALAAHPPFLGSMLKLLAELAPRFRMAVVSSSFRREIFPAIEAAGLAPLFQTIITGDEAENLKPAPDLYLLAVERLGVSTPLVIEDSDSGVAAGLAAGLEVLRVSGVDRVAEEVRARLETRT